MVQKKSLRKNPIIAVAQIRYYDSPEKHNLKKIKKYISLAKQKNAEIVCFPETCIHKTEHLNMNHLLIKEIQKSCRENSIWCIVTDSFIVKRIPYKMALLIDRKGNIRGKYKKINLYDDSGKPGKKIFVFQTDFAKIGIAICWDLAFPKLFQHMKQSGAEIIFCPSKWCYETVAHQRDPKKRELKLLKSLIISRAFENLVFMALINPVMDKKGLVSYSAIACTHHIITDILDKEGLITAKLNLKEIKKFSKIYPHKK